VTQADQRLAAGAPFSDVAGLVAAEAAIGAAAGLLRYGLIRARWRD